MREHDLRIATLGGDAQEPAKYPKEDCCNDPECSANTNIPQHLASGMPLISKNDEDICAPMSHARHH